MSNADKTPNTPDTDTPTKEDKGKKAKVIDLASASKLIMDADLRARTGTGMFEKPLTPEQRQELMEWKEYQDYDRLLLERNKVLIEKKSLQKQNKRLRETQEQYNNGLRGTITKILNNFLDLFFVVIAMWIGFILGNVKSIGYKAVASKGTIVFLIATGALAFLIALFSYMRNKTVGTVDIKEEGNRTRRE